MSTRAGEHAPGTHGRHLAAFEYHLTVGTARSDAIDAGALVADHRSVLSPWMPEAVHTAAGSRSAAD